jgi:hypothetical protein
MVVNQRGELSLREKAQMLEVMARGKQFFRFERGEDDRLDTG